MFDTFFGLPLHVFIIHATVIFVPLGGLATAAVLLRPAWRARFAAHAAALNVALLVLTFVTVQAGQQLQAQLGGQIAQTHEDLANILLWIMVALAAGSLALWGAQLRADVPTVARTGLAVVVALLALTSVGEVIAVGHTGAESHWGSTFDRPAP